MPTAFMRDSWYVAAWSRDVADRPLARTMLGEAVVIYRREDGSVVALEDRCPHRHLPLSMGKIVEDGLQCGYHGLTFAPDGRCVLIPSQSFVPPVARVRAYPAIERYGWVWLWMGDPARADRSAIPDFSLLESPRHAAVGKTNRVAADYRLVTDNLMDLSHVGFVHTTTIGNAAFGENARLDVVRTERGVRATRLVANVPQPPLYERSGRLPPGVRLDRWSVIDFIAPCFVLIHTGGAQAGTGVLEGRYEHGLNLWVVNAMTPETETTTSYHWASVRSHALDDPAADDLFMSGVSEAFEEDRIVLEAQQQVIGARGDSWALSLRADTAAVEARRVLDREIVRESETAGSADGT